jgi:hypothetical protein
MDLLGSSVTTDGTNLKVHIPVANLGNLSSPTTTSVPVQQNVWWLTRWQFKNKIYFAKVQNALVGGLSYTAGPAKSFDRPGLNGQTVATLVDFSGGSAVSGAKTGNEWVITVPPSVVGSPTTGDVLEQVTAYSMTDNGLPLAVSPCLVSTVCAVSPGDNIPTIFDATADYNALLGTLPPPITGTTSSTPGTSPVPSVLPDTAVIRGTLTGASAARLALTTVLVLLAMCAIGLVLRYRRVASK